MHPTLPVEYLCSIAADLHHAEANYLYLEIQRALSLRLKEETTKLLPTYPRPIRGCGGSVKVKGRIFFPSNLECSFLFYGYPVVSRGHLHKFCTSTPGN